MWMQIMKRTAAIKVVSKWGNQCSELCVTCFMWTIQRGTSYEIYKKIYYFFCSIINESEIVKYINLLAASMVQYCQNKLRNIDNKLIHMQVNFNLTPKLEMDSARDHCACSIL